MKKRWSRPDPVVEEARKVTKALARQGHQPGVEAGGLAFAARFLKGGRKELVELARASNDPKVQLVVKQWDELSPNGQTKVKLENLCEAAGITAGDFLGIVARDVFESALDISKLVLGLHHNRVLQRSVKQALTADGFKDREMLMKASRFLPTATGTNVDVRNMVNAQAAVTVEQPKGLPAFEEVSIVATKAVRAE